MLKDPPIRYGAMKAFAAPKSELPNLCATSKMGFGNASAMFIAELMIPPKQQANTFLPYENPVGLFQHRQDVPPFDLREGRRAIGSAVLCLGFQVG